MKPTRCTERTCRRLSFYDLEPQLLESELRDYCRARLSAFKVPDHIYIVAAFPHTAKGSIDRHAIAARFAPSSPSVSGRQS